MLMQQKRSYRQAAVLPWPLIVRGIFMLVFFWVNLTFSPSVFAATTVPTKMNFQGRLADATGTVVTDGSYNMKFALYTASSGGSPVWSETRETTNRVTVTNGIFAVKLGDVSALPASIFASGSLYFEITMANPATATCSTASCQTWESAMARTLVSTSAYAYNAETLDGIDGASFAQLSGANAFTSTNSVTVTSANALVVAGSSNLFRVDTSASQVVIGTSDANASLLVLDTKTSAGDPTGVPGGTYYNSSAGKFRCYENAVWKDCISVLPQSVYLSSDTAAITSSTPTNVTGMSFTLAANTKYHYKFVTQFKVNNTATGIGMGVTYSGSGTNQWCNLTIATRNAATGGQWAGYCATGDAAGGAETYDSEATSDIYPSITEGYISTTTTGTLQLRVLNQDTNWSLVVKAGTFGVLEVIQ